MPSISVIVPVYKVEPYIHRCIDSVLSQTFTDFELILVDDGSPDDCPAICDEYAIIDNRIHVIHQKNGGLSAARNTGLDYVFSSSNSEWVSFVDSDDWIHPQYLEYLYISAIESDSDASVCLYSFENEYVRKAKYDRFDWQSYRFEDFFCFKLTGLNSIIACGKLYRKYLFKDKRYPVGKINEDLFVTPIILSDCNHISVTNVVLYYYYQSDNSIMRKQWDSSRLDEIEGSEYLINFLRKKQLKKAEISAVRRFFWVLDRQRKELNTLPQKDDLNNKYLNRKYREALFRYRHLCLSKEIRYYYEKEFPRLSWCYWTCVGIIGKIKRIVREDAKN